MKLAGILIALCLLGCQSEHEVSADLTFETEDFVSGSLDDIEFNIGDTEYKGTWSILDSFKGPLDSMPANYRGPDHEYSPVLLYRKSDASPRLTTNVRPIDGTSRSRILFRSNIPGPNGEHSLERMTIYFLDAADRRLHPLAKFDRSDSEMDIHLKARVALRKRIEQGDDAN